jgi:transposase-like protein
MTAERSNYTEAFKREAVRLMETSGKPVAQLARDWGG